MEVARIWWMDRGFVFTLFIQGCIDLIFDCMNYFSFNVIICRLVVVKQSSWAWVCCVGCGVSVCGSSISIMLPLSFSAFPCSAPGHDGQVSGKHYNIAPCIKTMQVMHPGNYLDLFCYLEKQSYKCSGESYPLSPTDAHWRWAASRNIKISDEMQQPRRYQRRWFHFSRSFKILSSFIPGTKLGGRRLLTNLRSFCGE